MWLLPTAHTFILVLLAAISAPSTQEVNYVRPNSSLTCAAAGQGGQGRCLTVQQYLSEKNYFIPGAVFKFISGNHSLQNYNILPIESVAHVTLEGDSAVNVILSNNTRVIFNNVTNLTIERLTFIINSGTNSSFMFYCSKNIFLSATRFLRNARSMYTWSIIYMQDSSATIENCSFTGVGNFNFSAAKCSGSAVHANLNSFIRLTGNNSFIDNTAYDGGGLCLSNSRLSCEGYQVFVGNKAHNYGGGIYLSNSDAYLGGTSILLKNNSAHVGGAIYCSQSNLTSNAGELHFEQNSVSFRGGGMRIIEIHEQNSVTIAAASFVNNTAFRGGGAVYIESARSITFKNLVAIGNNLTALSCLESDVTFSQSTTFANNTGKQGGAVWAVASDLSFYDYAVFRGNTAKHGGAIYSQFSTNIKLLNGTTIFQDNNATKNGGAIFAVHETDFTLHGIVNFISNNAIRGGAMYFRQSKLTLVNNVSNYCSLNTISNHASDYGGAIYYEDNNITPSQCSVNITHNHFIAHYDLIGLPYCFLEFKTGSEYTIPSSVPLSSLNDSSGNIEGNNFLYGGMIDRCRVRTDTATTISLLQTDFFKNATSQHNAVIILKPLKLCFCNLSLNDRLDNISRKIFRGQNISLSLQAFDLVNRTTAAIVHAKTRNNTEVDDRQLQQNITRGPCSTLTYTLHPKSTIKYETIDLYLDHCKKEPIKATINVSFLPCPNAFDLTSDGKCGCENRLRMLGAECTIKENDNHTITKDNSHFFWMGFHTDDNESYHGLILSTSCPSEYCKSGTMDVTLDNLDAQCVQNRTGMLCGACITNYSLLLGSSACKKCSNANIALIFFLFVSSGIGLVFLLTVLRLTVATGMMNSLIIYINIVHINRTSFLPNEPIIVGYIITWFNFEFGFKTCFYDGMDVYVRTWLQFAFPLYVWFLITLIIFASRYSMKISKWIGSNPVAVLATLMLMSYAKLLSIFIDVYSPVLLDFPDNKTVMKWLIDANVPYMESKHLVLALVTTLVLLLFFLPYTFLLLLGYKLYSYTDRKYFRWLLKIKPLLDSYYAPYESHARYWTGFLLLVRCVLYIVFAFDPLEENDQSLLAIVIVSAIVGIYFALKRIYTNFYTNVIEASIYLNLIILSATTLAKVNNSPQLAYTLIGIFFLTMLGVIAYHFHLNYIAGSKLWLRATAKFNSLKKAVLKSKNSHQEREDVALPLATVTETVISLRESLLENSSDNII